MDVLIRQVRGRAAEKEGRHGLLGMRSLVSGGAGIWASLQRVFSTMVRCLVVPSGGLDGCGQALSTVTSCSVCPGTRLSPDVGLSLLKSGQPWANWDSGSPTGAPAGLFAPARGHRVEAFVDGQERERRCRRGRHQSPSAFARARSCPQGTCDLLGEAGVNQIPIRVQAKW